MDSVVRAARLRLIVALSILALVVPSGLFAARYPRWWEWIALEQTPMTWVQSVVLVLAAAASGLLFVVTKLRGVTRWQRLPHGVLATGFAALALDERFAIHERVRDRYLAPRDVRLPGVDWIGPGDFLILGVAVAGLVVLPVVMRAYRSDRLALVLLGLGVVVSAVAVGMDAVDPALMTTEVERIEQTVEEAVELLGGCLFLAAVGVRLLGELGSREWHVSRVTSPTLPAGVTSSSLPAGGSALPEASLPDPEGASPAPRWIRERGEDLIDSDTSAH